MTGAEVGFQRLVGGPWLDGILALLATLALFATSLQALRLATPLAPNVSLAIAGAFALACFTLSWRYYEAIARKCCRLLSKVSEIPLWLIALLGLALRVTWITAFSAEPGSDGKVYLDLGTWLSQGESYELEGNLAYWPIGYPLYLAAWFALPTDPKTAVLLSNLAAFLIGLSGVAHLARTLAGEPAARIAALIFAVWPNLVFNSATPEKEMLVLGLLPWATSLLIRSVRSGASLWTTLAAGMLMGAATLVQPSLQFLPLVGAIFLLGIGRCSGRCMLQGAVVIVGAITVIAPWSIRNYQHFDQFVLVSTNGGDVLYRANNPLATGAYMPRGEIDLSNFGELERDELGRRHAAEWIRNNPAAFGALVIEKQILFMGDDSVGVYTTLKVGKASGSGLVYALFKAFSNAWWMLVWAALLAFSLTAMRRGTSLPALARTPIWLWLYLFAIHSIFESTGKYHVPVISMLCVMLAVFTTAVERARDTSTRKGVSA